MVPVFCHNSKWMNDKSSDGFLNTGTVTRLILLWRKTYNSDPYEQIFARFLWTFLEQQKIDNPSDENLEDKINDGEMSVDDIKKILEESKKKLVAKAKAKQLKGAPTLNDLFEKHGKIGKEKIIIVGD